MIKDGRSLAEIKAALPDAPAPGAPPPARGAAPAAAGGGGGRGGPAPLTFVETAYQELTKGARK
jgi:hypothetical protein